MKKIIVYCHGYGSSSKTDKVERLRAVENSEVVAFDINIDPNVSVRYLLNTVTDYMLTTRMHEAANLVFVGTSLGAWYANILGNAFRAKTVLINPCYDPKNLLIKYGVDKEILNKYSPIIPNPLTKVFIAQNDEVIDYEDFDFASGDITFVPSGGHRFNGVEFEKYIVGYLNTI